MKSILDKKRLSLIKKELKKSLHKRNRIIQMATDTTSMAKKTILAGLAGDVSTAVSLLRSTEKMIKSSYKVMDSLEEYGGAGPFLQSLEEYVEAVFVVSYLQKKSFSDIKFVVPIPNDVYIAGLCDFVGELHRQTVYLATKKQLDDVIAIADFAREINGTLIDFHLTKYLRTKYDQARQAERKIEMISYELAIRMS